jgi:hypothetical protein
MTHSRMLDAELTGRSRLRSVLCAKLSDNRTECLSYLSEKAVLRPLELGAHQ